MQGCKKHKKTSYGCNACHYIRVFSNVCNKQAKFNKL